MAKIDKKAYDKLDYPLALVSTAADGKYHGCIVNSLHQVTSSMPPKFSITVNKSNETFKAIEASGSFSAIVLSKDDPEELVNLFGYKSGRVTDKYAGYEVGTDGNGTDFPGWRSNLSLALRLRERLNQGGACLGRPVSLRNSSYNQEVAPAALLLEIGSGGNTVREAIRAAELTGAELAILIRTAP